MKYLFLLFVVCLISFSSFAQTNKTDSSTSSIKTMSKLKPPKDQPFFYYIYLQGGKMIMDDGNKLTPITKPFICDNGTTVSPNGTILTNFGNTMKFTRDGEAISKSGKFTSHTINNKKTNADSSKQQ